MVLNINRVSCVESFLTIQNPKPEYSLHGIVFVSFPVHLDALHRHQPKIHIVDSSTEGDIDAGVHYLQQKRDTYPKTREFVLSIRVREATISDSH